MVRDGEASGQLTPGKTLLDATSGNTGIAYAMIGAARGFAVKLCVPANVTPERKRILRAYGAELVLTDPLEGTTARFARRARVCGRAGSLLLSRPVQQPGQLARALRRTGPEILAQTDGRITHFVAGLGTSGTFMGAGRRSARRTRRSTLVSVQPDSPLHGLEGLKHMDIGDRAGHLRPGAGRRGSARRHRRGVRMVTPPGARGRAARRHLERRRARGARCDVARHDSTDGVDRHEFLRRRRPIPVGALLGGAAEGSFVSRGELT